MGGAQLGDRTFAKTEAAIEDSGLFILGFKPYDIISNGSYRAIVLSRPGSKELMNEDARYEMSLRPVIKGGGLGFETHKDASGNDKFVISQSRGPVVSVERNSISVYLVEGSEVRAVLRSMFEYIQNFDKLEALGASRRGVK